MHSAPSDAAQSCSMSANPPAKLDLIAESAAAIDHSRWGNRLVYLAALTGALMVGLGLAIQFDKPAYVISTLAWMIVFAATLTVVTPSAEQMTKMLAQVAAIRAGTKGADLFAGEAATKANPSILQDKTVGQFLTWLKGKTGEWAR